MRAASCCVAMRSPDKFYRLKQIGGAARWRCLSLPFALPLCPVLAASFTPSTPSRGNLLAPSAWHAFCKMKTYGGGRGICISEVHAQLANENLMLTRVPYALLFESSDSIFLRTVSC